MAKDNNKKKETQFRGQGLSPLFNCLNCQTRNGASNQLAPQSTTKS